LVKEASAPTVETVAEEFASENSTVKLLQKLLDEKNTQRTPTPSNPPPSPSLTGGPILLPHTLGQPLQGNQNGQLGSAMEEISVPRHRL
jgi:hypothetical protein